MESLVRFIKHILLGTKWIIKIRNWPSMRNHCPSHLFQRFLFFYLHFMVTIYESLSDMQPNLVVKIADSK